jgi:hypothetical protein
MKAFALVFNDGRDVEQDFLDQVDNNPLIQNWLYIHPIIFLASDHSAHVLAETIRQFDSSRWFFITEIALGANNGMQPPGVWSFVNTPQAKNIAQNWVSEILGSSHSKSKEPLPPPRASVPAIRRKASPPASGSLKALLDSTRDKK